MVRLATFRKLDLQNMEDAERSLVRAAEQESRRQLRPAIRRQALRSVDAIATAWEEIEMGRGGWRHVEEGILRSYRRARKASVEQPKANSDERIHEWRKRVKELMYQLRLLAPIDPHRIKKLTERLEDLDDALGGDHDLAVLRVHLHGTMRGDQRRLRLADIAIAGDREHVLQKARHAGAKFFHEKPGEFTERLKERWRKWRKG